MFKNIFLTTIRNISRYRVYALINILGLTIGIACAFLVFTYVRYELSYNKFLSDHERIYRVRSDRYFGETIDPSAFSAAPLAPALKTSFPQVEYATRFSKSRPSPVLNKNQKYYVNDICAADLDFFEIFDVGFVLGSNASFQRPNTAVMTKNLAEKFFNKDNPIGKIIIRDSIEYEIIGVINNWPSNSHIRFDLIISREPHEELDFVIENPWVGIAFSYIKLRKDADPVQLDEAIRDIYLERVDPALLNPKRKLVHFLQALDEIHLGSKYRNDIEKYGNRMYLYLFSAVGLLILIIACINYMNLNTARFQTRAKEISIRKTVGASRKSIIAQFFIESILFAFIAHIFALFIVELLLPTINSFLDLDLKIHYTDLSVILGLLFLILFTGFLAGSYPAFYLSGLKPIAIMRGKIKTGKSGIWSRRILVIFQFTVSIALVIGVVTILKQLDYMKSYSLGFSKENRVVIRFPRNHITNANYDQVKNEFLKVPGVNGGTFSSTVPGQWNYVWRTYLPGEEKNNILMNWYAVDEDFVDVMNLNLITGRNFYANHSTGESESGDYIINEAAVKIFGWETPENAVGQHIWRETRNVIGVVKDFNLKGLQEPIGPMGMFFIDDDHKYLIMDVIPENIPDLIQRLEGKYEEIFPNMPLLYFFLDEDFNKQYKSEEQLGFLFSGLTLLGLIIAGLGLIGLASFMAQQRTKEIGIRKANGAGIKDIILLLIKDFSRWVLVANIIAWPLAYYFLSKWLSGFAYQTKQSLFIYFCSGIIILFIALISVSFQAIKAANANPVDALRYE